MISDKTTLCNCQYLILGLWYLNKKTMKVHKDSTVFKEIKSTTAANIYAYLKEMLQSTSLPLNLCVGTAFDGASNMSGRVWKKMFVYWF